MQGFEKLGVFLNGEPGDREALRFAARLAQFTGSQSLLCAYVPEVEPGARVVGPDEEQVRSEILGELPEDVARLTTVEMHAATGIAEILRTTRDQALDLLVVGRRLPHDQLAVGSAFARLARKAPCSVLVVPHLAHAHFGRILVPTDCSEHSKLAVLTAIGLADACGEPNPQVVVQSVYSVGYGYGYLGMKFHEAVAHMEKVTLGKLEAFLADVKRDGVPLEVICTCSERPTAAVYDMVSSRNLDLIVAGSRGLSKAAAALLGSFSERLLMYSPIPMLVVKKKGETLRFLEALLSA